MFGDLASIKSFAFWNIFATVWDFPEPLAPTIAKCLLKNLLPSTGIVTVGILANLEKIGFGKVPVCMAKTQYSLTDDQTKLGRPTGFRITVRQVTISAGAGFVVALTGEIMKMPGLPKVPAAEKIDVDENGVISGLF